MKILRGVLLGASLGLVALPAFGQSIQAQNASGSEAGSITMDVVFNDNGSAPNDCIVNYQFTVDVSDITGNGGSVNISQCLNAVPEPHASDSFTDCSLDGTDVNVVVFDTGNNEINSGVGDLIFSGLSPGTYDVFINSVVFTRCDFVEINPGTGIDGTVTVTAAAPEYSSNPGGGSTLFFDSVQQGGSENVGLVITNVGDADLVVSNVGITGDVQGIFRVDSADQSFTLNPSQSRTVDFFCEPTLSTPADTYTVTVTVSNNDADESSVNYTLSCEVFLAPSGVVVSLTEPPECSFGVCPFPDTPVGEASAPLTFMLTNTDDTDAATGFSINTSNANFSQTNDCGTNLDPQASCNIDVTFTPLSTGDKSANLSVGGGNLQSGVSTGLTGTGTPGNGGGDDDDDDDDDDGGLLALGPYVSGSYFAGSSQDGHGWLVEAIGGEAPAKGTGIFVVYWFAFLNGEQAWLVASGTFEPGATSVTVDAQITDGGDFPDDPFDPDAVNKSEWGTLTFEFNDDCSTGTMAWEATGEFAADFGSGSLPLERITQIVDCPAVR